MNRIFQNLIKNSLQSIDKDGTIKIITTEDSLDVIVVIEDDGEGMDKETLKKLFEPNFSTKSAGMGLGLSITKKSLDSMKAKIEYESEKNTGTKVIIKLSKKFTGK
jgi:signal transduction histidine kinase